MLQVLHYLAQSSSYYSTSSSANNPSDEVGGLVFGTMFLVFLGLMLVAVVLNVIGLWKTFEKAGKPGWAAIVPVYNGMVLAEVAGYPSWYGLGFLVNPISLVVSIIFGLSTAKRFNRSEAFGILLLALLPVGYIILGLNRDVYNPHATPTVK